MGGAAANIKKRSEIRVVLGRSLDRDELRQLAPPSLIQRVVEEPQKAIPAIAKDPAACAQIKRVVGSLETRHLLYHADSRRLEIEEGSVDLVLTSPPYWTLKIGRAHV